MTTKLVTPLRAAAVLALAFTAACDNPLRNDDHEDDVVGVEITDMAGAVLASYAAGVWTITGGDALHVHVGEELEVRIHFIAEDGDRFQLPLSGSEYTLRVDFEHTGIVEYEGHADHGHFVGIAEGETTARIQQYHGNHPDFQTVPGVPIEVVDHDH